MVNDFLVIEHCYDLNFKTERRKFSLGFRRQEHDLCELDKSTHRLDRENKKSESHK